ncbi:GTP cyclohydrolase I [Sorangium cellulosum]|uniref:GTP cyclohydrolase I n=1 Tax=Sorangium cellulosum So0157-2 TaxID=1254432 RepID=S4XIQ1_SORCE|nr:GTP cyclohydrolase I [Sorangium cellulosum]AGP33017.1 GTP cyclohydrolase [Sorangium cellulosum So0157-2]
MIDRQRAARAIEEFLRALGRDVEGELAGTGERVADAWADDLIEGEAIDAAAVLREGAMEMGPFERGLVVARDLSVTTMCPHHLLPGHGTGVVAYLPGARVAGIGTIAHVLDALARRLTLQERIGGQLVDLLVGELGARGALCKLTLTHTCLIARGERKAGAVIETVAVAGVFAEPGPERDLAFAAALEGGRR